MWPAFISHISISICWLHHMNTTHTHAHTPYIYCLKLCLICISTDWLTHPFGLFCQAKAAAPHHINSQQWPTNKKCTHWKPFKQLNVSEWVCVLCMSVRTKIEWGETRYGVKESSQHRKEEEERTNKKTVTHICQSKLYFCRVATLSVQRLKGERCRVTSFVAWPHTIVTQKIC